MIRRRLLFDIADETLIKAIPVLLVGVSTDGLHEHIFTCPTWQSTDELRTSAYWATKFYPQFNSWKTTNNISLIIGFIVLPLTLASNAYSALDITNAVMCHIPSFISQTFTLYCYNNLNTILEPKYLICHRTSQGEVLDDTIVNSADSNVHLPSGNSESDYYVKYSLLPELTCFTLAANIAYNYLLVIDGKILVNTNYGNLVSGKANTTKCLLNNLKLAHVYDLQQLIDSGLGASDDWYIPSLEELAILHIRFKHIIPFLYYMYLNYPNIYLVDINTIIVNNKGVIPSSDSRYSYNSQIWALYPCWWDTYSDNPDYNALILSLDTCNFSDNNVIPAFFKEVKP